MRTTMAVFERLKLARVKEFQLQTRPFQWAECATSVGGGARYLANTQGDSRLSHRAHARRHAEAAPTMRMQAESATNAWAGTVGLQAAWR